MSFSGFDIPAETRMLADTVRDFVRNEIVAVEDTLPGEAREIPPPQLAELQRKARAAGLWCFEAPEQ